MYGTTIMCTVKTHWQLVHTWEHLYFNLCWFEKT